MPGKIEILRNLEDVFLKIQNKIRKIYSGSVIRSIFYSVAAEIENVYDEIEELKKNSYIHTASGEYLDNLIYGIAKLERLKGKRAFGYVVLEPIDFTLKTTNSINKLVLHFAKYDFSSGSLSFSEDASFFEYSTTSGKHRYVLLPPISLMKEFFDDSYYEFEGGRQKILDIFIERLNLEFNKSGRKEIKYIVLPVVSLDFGANKNLPTNFLNETLTSRGTFLVLNNFDFFFDKNLYTYVDIDNVTKDTPSGFELGEASIISGGQDAETDESYRKRFYLYLASLSSSTKEAIEAKVKELVPEANVRITPTEIPGVIDLFIDARSFENPVVTYLLEGEIEKIKPVGTIVNIKTPKVIYINVLFDLNNFEEKEFTPARQFVFEEIAKTETSQAISLSNINKILYQKYNVDNVVFGLTLNKTLFQKYKHIYKKIVCLYHKNPSELSFCSNNNDISYYDYLNIVRRGDLALFIYKQTDNYMSFRTSSLVENESIQKIRAPRYPLKEVVRHIRSGKVLDIDQKLYEEIRDCNAPPEICLRKVSLSNVLNDPFNPKNFFITIKDVESVDIYAANYYKIKFLTVPAESPNDIEICLEELNDSSYCSSSAFEGKLIYYLSNDASYIKYTDLDEIRPNYFEKIRLGSNGAINEDFVLKYNVGIRRL